MEIYYYAFGYLLVMLCVYVFFILSYIKCENKKTEKEIENQDPSIETMKFLYQISVNNINYYKKQIFSFLYYTLVLYGVLFGLYKILNNNFQNSVFYGIYIYVIIILFISFLGIYFVLTIQSALRYERARLVMYGDLFRQSLPDYSNNRYEKKIKEYKNFWYDKELIIYLSTNIIGYFIFYFLPCFIQK